jgi:hypothetical protein
MLSRRGLKIVHAQEAHWVEFNESEIATLQMVSPITMTSWNRLQALAIAVRYINLNSIEGDFVECGVWAGGSIAAAAKLDTKSASRKYWLYDTFEGMTRPTIEDSELALIEWETKVNADGTSEWCRANQDQVRKNLIEVGVNINQCIFVVGDVTETLLIDSNLPKSISLLRLDTDWYKSTKIELETLYSRLSPGGVLVIDDYGDWEGSRRATEEFFSQLDFKPLLFPIDSAGRILVKPIVSDR